MGQDTDVARVAAALRAPAIRYRSFGNEAVRTPPPVEAAPQVQLAAATVDQPDSLMPSWSSPDAQWAAPAAPDWGAVPPAPSWAEPPAIWTEPQPAEPIRAHRTDALLTGPSPPASQARCSTRKHSGIRPRPSRRRRPRRPRSRRHRSRRRPPPDPRSIRRRALPLCSLRRRRRAPVAWMPATAPAAAEPMHTESSPAPVGSTPAAPKQSAPASAPELTLLRGMDLMPEAPSRPALSTLASLAAHLAKPSPATPQTDAGPAFAFPLIDALDMPGSGTAKRGQAASVPAVAEVAPSLPATRGRSCGARSPSLSRRQSHPPPRQRRACFSRPPR
jgi:hypothetical protein